ncbi:MAG: phosphatidate cytidylyltransferase [Caldilineaceae bacterium]|nr:phosphatidate cytidylyltransferase [Caldilineaceae bacterium]MBP8108917.1 phosphatidate cytidylyltransferase [Caldilineaceae bacterium]MBP8124044.1 phosphatidate cytidylyltransferase [Caldilineaceae bacterium]MBP9074686.1 phosphatidate cytidylyltransferase [Caldilineaceae bacterium]
MFQRFTTALFLLPPVLAALWVGGVWWTVLILAVSVAAGHEMFALLETGGFRPARYLGMLWIALLVLRATPILAIVPLNALLAAGLIAVFILAMYRTEQPLSTWISTSAGAIYLGVMLGQLAGLRLLEDGLWWVLFALFVTWGNDTVAYFVGVTVGKHKLWPRLSPKKSWEGTVGGWVGAALFGGAIAHFSPLPMSFGAGAAVGAIGGVLALYGDLSISLVKRQVGVKDSGNLFPGHGGMLDRLDSLLFVFPFVFQIALIWK